MRDARLLDHQTSGLYLVQIIFYFWSFEIKECILRTRKKPCLDSFS